MWFDFWKPFFVRLSQVVQCPYHKSTTVEDLETDFRWVIGAMRHAGKRVAKWNQCLYKTRQIYARYSTRTLIAILLHFFQFSCHWSHDQRREVSCILCINNNGSATKEWVHKNWTIHIVEGEPRIPGWYGIFRGTNVVVRKGLSEFQMNHTPESIIANIG